MEPALRACDAGRVASPIDEYVTALAAAVLGRGSRRLPRLLQEVRDHLDDAAAHGVDGGLDPLEAEQRAVATFGAVDQVAPAYRAAIGLSRVRSSSAVLVGLLLLQPLAWSWWQGARDGGRTVSPLAVALNHAVELVGIGSLIGLPMLLAAAGLLQRRYDCAATLTRITGTVVALAAAAVAVLATALNALQPRPLDIAFTALVVALPALAIAVLSARWSRLPLAPRA